MIYETIKINDEWVPKPDNDLEFGDEKIKAEKQTEAGTTMVIVTRPSKITITGSWTLSGKFVKKFREWRKADTVKVEAYYPDPNVLSEYECQFSIDQETHITDARVQIPESGGVYQINVTITEL